jgi:carbamoyltransferase
MAQARAGGAGEAGRPCVRILGISAWYHDSAACLVEDGRIVAAAQEERFTRKKHDAGFPKHAVAYCLREAGISLDEVDFVGFYEKPLVKFERLLETYISYAPAGLRSYLMALPVWLGEKLWLRDEIAAELDGYRGEVLFGTHHESHAASAFYPSPFENAAVLTIDGVGEWATSSIGVGRGHDLTLLRETRFPHSLGLLYSAFTYYCGFKVNSGEYKVMGLAPYGEPKYVQLIKDRLLEIGDDGSLWMNMEYFSYPQALTMTGGAFAQLFGGPAREPESKLTQREMDLARSVQDITEEVMTRMARFARRETGLPYLCMAGGVALNCVGNGRILRDGPFEEIWIQPAAGDAGGALGVALSLWHKYLGNPRQSAEARGTWMPTSRARASGIAVPPYDDAMNGALLGPGVTDTQARAWIDGTGYTARRYASDRDLADTVAALLEEGKIVALCQGRMEFGPRALGARSIIGDARSPQMQSLMNLKIKFRESFRPFAPAVLREHVSDWFDLDRDSPYMLLVADVANVRRVPVSPETQGLWGIDQLNVPRSTIPAVTHVDGSARIQTVRRETNPLYHAILEAFYRRTGCPVIVNTSFNVRGEPIVCTLDDAYRCFMRTNIDALVVEKFVLDKSAQAAIADDGTWRKAFVLD